MCRPRHTTTMAQTIDDKSDHCISFILSHYKGTYKDLCSPPLFVGLNGVQGCGKTTLVSRLAQRLREEHGLETLVLSLDDLYLTHEDQVALANAHPQNPLIQHRGEPGTHDIPHGIQIFTSLAAQEPNIIIPSYDKSAFSGAGDRAPQENWPIVNHPGSNPVRIVILEGWMLGFRSLSSNSLSQKRQAPSITLFHNREEDLSFINEELKKYEVLWDYLGCLIHIDADDLKYVYEWRLEAEFKLREVKGVENAMTDDQVKSFVDGYFPAYELYTEGLREGKWRGEEGKKLRMVVDRARRVKDVLMS